MGNLTINDVLNDIDRKEHLTFDDVLALDSFGADIIPKLQSRYALEERDKNLSENQVWDRIRENKVNSSTVRSILHDNIIKNL